MQNRKTKLKNAEQENKNHCSWRDLSPIPGLGRSPGEGNSYPLQCSGLENSMDCIIHGVAKSWTWLTFTFTFGVHRGAIWGSEPQSPFPGLSLSHFTSSASCCYSFAKSCSALCNPMDCSRPDSVLCYLPEYSDSCPSSQWCYLTISSSAIHFSFCLQSFSASGSFPVSQLFTSGGQSIGVFNPREAWKIS